MVLRRLHLIWRALPLPWRSARLVGSDPQREFLFFEAPPMREGSLSRTRRSVEYLNGKQEDYTGDQIPVQWMAWLRHTRTDPPTHEEIIQADEQRMRIQQLALMIEEKDRLAVLATREAQAKLLAEAKANAAQQLDAGPQTWSPAPKPRT
ncbi:hypothetical protein HDU78_007392 [Chytriomyces hyalinus]|uniref:NADH dehydrogenase [ubiquinone] 1 alpha subcomplex subunit n=1 Tax=Chytriomyces confervae TaxID=246404 RepID=A0A507FM70_9FUNG|nr:hypothetical protein HDU78_007392 [Chytriomyces hyalinus]KAJ3265531.1 hypothetical protein HDU77_004797 [Chytriomyces hyalinus]KAJ3408983.1 hypothetical protein HDU80_003639 [Chytriomyces hyalinus]TPX76810.1 hypothetical protein CcCBS67573_g01937 [Chytriomyces confervae]